MAGTVAAGATGAGAAVGEGASSAAGEVDAREAGGEAAGAAGAATGEVARAAGTDERQRQRVVLAQSNLAGNIVESVDVEAFRDILDPRQSRNFTRVRFQNCREQPRYKTDHKGLDGSRAMAAGKYDVLFFVEHDLYGPALEPKHQMHDRMCSMSKGIMTRLSFNTNDGTGTNWRQYGGTGFTINEDMRAKMTQNGWGSDPTKLGR